MAVGAAALIGASLISALFSSLVSGVQNANNIQAQKDINKLNVEAQNSINQQNIQYSKEFAQNGISWKMEDLQNAGLNPVLAAGMSGVTSQPTAMSAPQQKAPMMDLSGISSAITAMNNMMLSTYLMNQRNEISSRGVDVSSDRNKVLSERNHVLENLYKRKAFVLESANQSPMIMNAKQMKMARKQAEEQLSKDEKEEWDKLLKDLNSTMPKEWRKK